MFWQWVCRCGSAVASSPARVTSYIWISDSKRGRKGVIQKIWHPFWGVFKHELEKFLFNNCVKKWRHKKERETPSDNQVMALITSPHDIRLKWKCTDTHHNQSSPHDLDKLFNHTRQKPQLYTHGHTDTDLALKTTKLPWHWLDWSDPRKAKQTHERAGAFVFVECHTSSRGKPITGRRRSLKLRLGCVGIASVATSDVSFNILIAGHFLD